MLDIRSLGPNTAQISLIKISQATGYEKEVLELQVAGLASLNLPSINTHRKIG